jgi:hypothetical protein
MNEIINKEALPRRPKPALGEHLCNAWLKPSGGGTEDLT